MVILYGSDVLYNCMAYIYHKFLFYTVHLLQFFFWMLYILEVKRKIFFNGHATGP
jgi:hypothetical protein